MHEQLIKLENVLKSSNCEFDKTEFDKNTVIYSATLDKETELRFDIISVQDGDGFILKFVLMIDDFDEDRGYEQLKSALMLNFISGLGKFAFNTDNGKIVYVLDYSLDLLNTTRFQSIVDEYYSFASQYYERVYSENNDELSGHD